MMTGNRETPNIIIRPKVRGTITVFLSLVLMLILSLLCTIIEGARVSTAKVFSERALSTAMDSVLAEYYGPLWEEYHIFGYYAGAGSDEEQKKRLEDLFSDYMTYSFEPDRDCNSTEVKNATRLYDITLGSVSVEDSTGLMDYEGELLINEAVEYMKYSEIGAGLEKLLDKLSLLEDGGKVSYIMEEKQKVEESLVKIDKEILTLMELYDGLKTSSKGVKLAKDGALVTTSSFIKKICYGPVSMTSVGINHEVIFETQKNNYVNPDSYFEDIDIELECINRTMDQIKYIQEEINVLEAMRCVQQQALTVLEAIQNKTDADKERIRQIKETIKDIDASIAEKKEQIQEQEESIERYALIVKDNSSKIAVLVNEITPLIGSAITSIDHIMSGLSTAAPLLEQYEQLLVSQKDSLSEDLYSGLEDDLKELKKYTGEGAGGYDYAGMKEILTHNQSALTQTAQALEWAEEEMANENYRWAGAYYTYAWDTLQTYQIEGLTLDYSTLVYDKSARKSPLDQANTLIQGGLASLVMDSDTSSKLELTSAKLLPSEVHELLQESGEEASGLTSFFKKAAIGDSNSGMGTLFGSFGDSTQLGDVLADGINSLAERLLYQAYLTEHFNRYQPPGSERNAQKPSVLAYEQEYLLSGKAGDQENLASVISRIIMIRMIFDFISVIKDSGIRNEAKIAATALVGFTGLPILVRITQVLIMLIWSFTEALLDTCALLRGKEIPIIKKNVVLTLPEIFLINRDYLQRKADSFTDSQELSLTYQEYLQIFLLMKRKAELAYRSMDLMQENIKLRYHADQFAIEDCLYGFDAKAEVMLTSKFTEFVFLSNSLKTPGGYHYPVTASYSY